MKWKTESLSYLAIAKRLSITRDAACNLYVYTLKTNKNRGPKLKMDKASTLRVKRKISALYEIGEKINSRKLIEECDLNASNCTVQRYLKKTGLAYKRISSRIHLTNGHMKLRMECIKSWITSIIIGN